MDMRENPLLIGLERVKRKIDRHRDLAREYYFAVLFSLYRCPHCDGRLQVKGASRCVCLGCKSEFDPTEEFQQSPCCSAGLVRKIQHYACRDCGQVAPSIFLFDERVFDGAYFAEKMRESRNRKQMKSEELRRILVDSRSEPLNDVDYPCPGALPGLVEDLDEFIAGFQGVSVGEFLSGDVFQMEEYRVAILAEIATGAQVFTGFPILHENLRLDMARRFITLIFMLQFGEVVLTQLGDQLLVERSS